MTVVDLVTHSSVDIAASAADVWPHVLEPNPWKQGLKPVRVSGPVDEVGEVRSAPPLTIETVVLQPLVRKVIRISSGSDLDPAWATWHLTSNGDTTTVVYDVYGQLEIGDTDPVAYVQGQQERFDAELLGLKQLVESGAAQQQ